MKKIVLMAAIVAVCVSARAALENRMWNAQWVAIDEWSEGWWGFPVGEYDSYGYGWYAEVFNISQAGHSFSYSDVFSPYSTEMYLAAGGLSPVLGWYDGFGYVIDEAAFGSATDLDTVQMVLYNNADKNLATALLYSDSLTLPDAPEIAGPDDVKVTFVNFHAIPEPSTALLLGTGGLVVWFGRRKLGRDTGTKVTPKKMRKVDLLHR